MHISYPSFHNKIALVALASERLGAHTCVARPKLSPPSICLLSTMSQQQEAETPRQKTNDLLAAGGNLAVLTLRGVNATAGWCPPLKDATSAALFIYDEVKKLKENAKEWTDFGEYVATTMANVSSAIKSDDVSAEEAKPWVESATELDR
ncbi:uncharacterized protein EI90DRAFT_53824 [Cantharellus anzutake]|uniref:uncharacterized protein n=1 Tax=Cantharellus anzutake TaxID=1750568 RepID=UPI00190741F3|nr:uncharacterized protein EI90DRAFT_53824 [Cantharellus anzutake]KAF8344170.1 hypothetical protein EI90DRAFT_53824 [Cantharellus anzutake]